MLKRNNLNLRPVKESDLPMLLEWRNSERIRANMYTDHIITGEEHRSWFNRLQQKRDIISLVFEMDQRPLGIVNINRIDRDSNSCHWGFYIGDPDAPRGSGIYMGYVGLEYIFKTLDFRKVTGEALVFNQASIAFHKKLGFSQEILPPVQVLKNGKYEDIVSFALTKDDWLRVKSDLEINYVAA
jgi:UDP-4-amino-4,6-dideoxy-N-acetyl-beta-L-altrosamine N-acetyltransferase